MIMTTTIMIATVIAAVAIDAMGSTASNGSRALGIIQVETGCFANITARMFSRPAQSGRAFYSPV